MVVTQASRPEQVENLPAKKAVIKQANIKTGSRAVIKQTKKPCKARVRLQLKYRTQAEVMQKSGKSEGPFKAHAQLLLDNVGKTSSLRLSFRILAPGKRVVVLKQKQR